MIKSKGAIMRYIKVINGAGVCVGYYNESEWDGGELRGVLNSTDKIEVYADDGAWIETLAGAEFLRGYVEDYAGGE